MEGIFKENCVLVHMGGSWGKNQALGIIKGGSIWYKQAKVYLAAVNIFTTTILFSDIDLVAMVGGKWKLASLTFSHLAQPLKLPGTSNQPSPQH